MPTQKDSPSGITLPDFACPRPLRGFAVKNASQPGEMPAHATTGIKLSIVFGSGAEIGPDKIALLEHIRDAGSISGAARHMGIQYKRAWMLLDSINRSFRQPVVKSVIGGAYAGAVLTPFGTDVLDRYRRIAAVAETAAAIDLAVLDRAALPNADQKVDRAAVPSRGDENRSAKSSR